MNSYHFSAFSFKLTLCTFSFIRHLALFAHFQINRLLVSFMLTVSDGSPFRRGHRIEYNTASLKTASEVFYSEKVTASNECLNNPTDLSLTTKTSSVLEPNLEVTHHQATEKHAEPRTEPSRETRTDPGERNQQLHKGDSCCRHLSCGLKINLTDRGGHVRTGPASRLSGRSEPVSVGLQISLSAEPDPTDKELPGDPADPPAPPEGASCPNPPPSHRTEPEIRQRSVCGAAAGPERPSAGNRSCAHPSGGPRLRASWLTWRPLLSSAPRRAGHLLFLHLQLLLFLLLLHLLLMSL